ncbi:hypothetical protein H2198_000289 [Neophaeococcomyces mojaviensis]|uniref:Uncharacterized protein n=1 Tax=Neophaeococcomyces mojaviensis TaxID=3383035 RepID=A0ACC3AKT0_9EURO|nr:hypothetical protein H2198_000289 [Knufia sp. JES_112]
MTEFLQQIEALAAQGKTNENISVETHRDTGEVTIYRYIPLIGPKREAPCLSKLLTLYKFHPETSPLAGGIDLSKVMVQVPEDGTLENTLSGFEALMTDLTATHVKAADTWLGTMRREEKTNEVKEEKNSVASITNGKTVEEEKKSLDTEEDEEDEWKEPSLTEQCQRMYREINDVLKRRNLAAVEGRWKHWEQFAGAEILMRVRHIWWMELDQNKFKKL